MLPFHYLNSHTNATIGRLEQANDGFFGADCARRDSYAAKLYYVFLSAYHEGRSIGVKHEFVSFFIL